MSEASEDDVQANAITDPLQRQVKLFALFDQTKEARDALVCYLFLAQGLVANIPHYLPYFQVDIQCAFSHLSRLDTQKTKPKCSKQTSRNKNQAAKQPLHNTLATPNASPVALSWFTGRNLEWIGPNLMIGYHLYYKSSIFAHFNSSNRLLYSVTSQCGRTMKLEESPDDIKFRIKLTYPFCDLTESNTFDIVAIRRMKALVYYSMLERGVLKRLNGYDEYKDHLKSAIIGLDKVHERISTTMQSQRSLSPDHHSRRHCILSARIFLNHLPDGQRFALIETAPQVAGPTFASNLALSPISAVAIPNKCPRYHSDEVEASSAKRTQTGSTQTFSDNYPTNHLEVVRSYAEKLLAECNHFGQEKAAHETQLQANQALVSELEETVTSHNATIADVRASIDEANRNHAAELVSHAEKIKVFQIDNKALNGKVNELLAANEHMREERDRMEKDHKEILQEEMAKAKKAARAEVHRQWSKKMLLAPEETEP